MTAAQLIFKPLPANGEIGVLTLTRPEAANSFNAEVIAQMTAHLETARTRATMRALIVRGAGKHFSAGADLAWMQASAKLSAAENRADTERLMALFEALDQVEVPTVAVVTGAAYGGAVGLVAACDIAIAATSARFALSEVRLGLLPAVILPYLYRKMQPSALRRLSLSGRVFDAQTALAAGLVSVIADPADVDEALRSELNDLLQGSPAAQGALKTLLRQTMAAGGRQGPYTAEAIAAIRVTPAAQQGLAAFFAKAASPWAVNLASEFGIDP